MNTNLISYLNKCIKIISKVSEKSLLNGLGELMTEDMKLFVMKKFKDEAIALLKLYAAFPIIDNFSHY
jgi:hypothetical protein